MKVLGASTLLTFHKSIAVSQLDKQVLGGFTKYGSCFRLSQDDTSLSWRKHKKHFFILSYAGKPIYSRFDYDDVDCIKILFYRYILVAGLFLCDEI